jgi:cAMP-dependent protein kinase regulator
MSERDNILRRAETLRLAGKDEDAVRAYQEALGLDLAAGQIARAISIHERLLQWRPGDFELHCRISAAIADARDGFLAAAARGRVPTPVAVSPLFAGIPRQELAALLPILHPRHAPAGEAIVTEGEPGDSLFLVVEGSLGVATHDERGDPVPLEDLGPGDFFGEVSLLTGRPRTATVTAKIPSVLLELDRSRVERLRQQFPNIEEALREFHRQRANHTVEAILEQRRRREPGAR